MPFIGKQSTSNSQITNYTTTVGSGGQTNFTVIVEGGDETHVYLNGVLLKETTDYTVSSTQVSLVSPAVENDIIEIKVFRSFALVDAVKATGDTMTGELEVPTVKLSSNVIKASDGGSTITLDDSDNVTVAGNLKVKDGGTIGSASDADAITISSTGAVTLSSDFVPSTPLSHRNFIYNGDFKIWQRSNSTSSVNIGNGAFQADRWKAVHDVSPEGLEFARSTDVPTGYGFANSLKITCDATDTSISASHAVSLVQEFESQDLVPWCYGTANAKNLMLSFWVKTNLTGSHSIGLIKHDNTRYGIPINYTVSSADTWEKKEILISPTAGSTSLITASGGAIDNNNGHGASLIWNLASGSNYQSTNNTWTTSIDKRVMGTSSDQNFVGSTSNNFYITGVQLELGSVATPFEHRSYGDELLRCQRYYYKTSKTGFMVGRGNGTSALADVALLVPVPLRATPTFDATGNFNIIDSDSYSSGSNAGMSVDSTSGIHIVGQISGLSNLTDNAFGQVIFQAGYSFDAEL